MLFSVSASNTFEIISFDFDPIGSTVRWNGTSGKTYAVMTIDNLMSNFWQTAVNGTNVNCRSIVTAVEDGELEYIEQDSVVGINKFYKLVAHDIPDGMVLIPGGMNSGTNLLENGEIYSNMYPSNYFLTVDFFYMDSTEVTKAQWDIVYDWAITNGYSFDNIGSGKANNHPVHTVNWYDCAKWCNARSEKDGRIPCYTVDGSVYKTGRSSPDCNFIANGYRLPTNDEWEYAARGGLSSKRFPWGDTITHNQANYYSSTSYDYDISATRGYNPAYTNAPMPYTSLVGSFAPNGYGLYDMAGNVWECCNTVSGENRNFRSGGWENNSTCPRCGYEISCSPLFSGNNFGFRSVCR